MTDATDASFQQDVLEAEGTILVDFWAPWCGPCRAVSPILEALADGSGGKITLVKVDIDENPEVAESYGVRSIPMMKVFRNGKVLKEIVGAKPRLALEHELKDFLA